MNDGQPCPQPAARHRGPARVPAARIASFSFHGDAGPALRNVQLSALPGTLTAVLGGSGSGKTTLGKLLAGWLRAGHSGVLRGSLALGADRCWSSTAIVTIPGSTLPPGPAGWATCPQDAGRHAVLGALHGGGGAGLWPGKPGCPASK